MTIDIYHFNTSKREAIGLPFSFRKTYPVKP